MAGYDYLRWDRQSHKMSPSRRHIGGGLCGLWLLLIVGSLCKYVGGQYVEDMPKVPFPALECNNHGYRDPNDIRSCVCFK